MKKILILTAIIGQFVFAQSKVGTTAANFLTIPVGPRASGMGGAYVALADDATALFWNSGAASRLQKSELTVAYSQWLVGTNYNWAGLVFKMSDDDAFGLSVNQLDYGEDLITTESAPMGTGERWSAQDIAIGLSYSRNLTDRFSIGGTVKYIRQQIWHESAAAFALDVGLLFKTQLNGLSLGMNISNFGTEMKLDGKDLFQPIDIDRKLQSGNNENIAGSLNTDSWTLPMMFTVGLNYSAIKTEEFVINIAGDAVYPNNHTSYFNLGSEFMWNNLVALRFGYNSLMKESALEGICGGLGVQYDFGPFISRIDYSYNDYGIFSQISKVSLSIGF